MEVEKSTRHRINISTSVKGVKTYDCTVELVNGTIEETLAESDRLVRELERRYPVVLEIKA